MTECPGRRLTAEVAEIHASYAAYQLGILPVEGGMLDQSATWTQAMTLLGICYTQHQEIERAKDA